MTAPLKTWQDVLLERGEPVLPGAAYDCPSCENRRHAFAIVLAPDDEWHCGTCLHPPAEDGPPPLSWDDVRGVRRVFLERTDWSQLADVPEETKAVYAPLRQRARDVTEAGTAGEAWELLQALLSDASKV